MKKYLLVMILILISKVVAASVSANLSADEVGIDDVFELTIKTDADSANTPDLTPLKDDFYIVSHLVSHQNYIINGKAQAETTWKIGLKPLNKGLLIIPSLNVGSQKTAPLQIMVTNAPSAITNTSKTPDEKAQSAIPDYALEAHLDKNTIFFIGQEMDYIVTLTDDGTIEQGEPSFEPTTDFIIKPLEDTKIVQNKEGRRQISFKFALFALKSGKLTLPTVYFKGYAYSKPDTDNFFGTGFFSIRMPSVFGIEKPVNLSFKGREIEIKPVPETYPAKWWLPAQNVRIKSNFVDLPSKLVQGMPIVRQITIEADGLTDTQLPELEFEDISGLKIYPEKPLGETLIKAGQLTGIQKNLITYIPEDSGVVTLPEIKVTWFDLTTNKIQQAVLPKEILSIKQNPNMPSMQTEAKNDVFLPQKTSESKNFTLPTNPYVMAGIAFILGILAAMLILRPKNTNPKPVKEQQIDYFKAIEKQKDIKKLRDSVILWAQQHFPHSHITNLKDVAMLLNNEAFDEQVKKLNTALYNENNKADFDIKRFVKVFKNAVKTNPKAKKSEPLPPLYKI